MVRPVRGLGPVPLLDELDGKVEKLHVVCLGYLPPFFAQAWKSLWYRWS